MPETNDRSQAKGLLLAFVGVMILTPDSLLIRMIEGGPWAILFWRGLLMMVGLGLMMLIRFRGQIWRRTVDIGAQGVLISVVFAINSVCFIVALDHTTVANVLLIVSTSPLISALIGLVTLGDRPRPSTWIAILIAMIGIGVIVEGGLASGTTTGDIAALGTAIGLGVHFNMVRAARDVDMIPAVGLSGIWTAAAGLIAAPDLAFTPQQMGLSAIIGVIIMPLSFGLLTIAPRYISAAEVSLMLLLETVLGPIWVWLVLFERPDDQTLIGGAVVLIALIGHSLISMVETRNRRRRRAVELEPRPGPIPVG
jgi:drug/metabolite transporter (DMT)-like permease